MYTLPRKPSCPPSVSRILLNDGALAPVVLLVIWFFMGLYALFASLHSDPNALQFFVLYILTPTSIAILFVVWRIPRRVRHIRDLWEKGEFIVGEVKSIEYIAKMGQFIHYQFIYYGETYNNILWAGLLWESPMQIPIIVNPGNPNDVIAIDVYY